MDTSKLHQTNLGKINIATGGICPCGGRLKYSEWETKKMIKETVRCTVCGRQDSAIRMKSDEIVPW